MYPTIKVVSANPQQSLSVRPLPVQPKVVVQPLKPQPKVVVTKANPTTSTSKPIVGPMQPSPPLKVLPVNQGGMASANFMNLLQPAASAREGARNLNANLDTRVVGVNGSDAPRYQAPRQTNYWKLLTQDLPMAFFNRRAEQADMATKLTKGFVQGSFRSGVAIGLEALNKGARDAGLNEIKSIPVSDISDSPWAKQVFGEGDFTDVGGLGSDTFKSFGAEGLSKNKGASLALGGLIAGLDFTGFGKADDAVKILTKTDDIGTAISTLKKLGVADDLVEDYAKVIVNTKNEKEVKQILDHLGRISDTTKISKTASNIDPRSGVKNLNIIDDAYKVIDDNAEALRPKLEKLKGAPMTAGEVKEAAKRSNVFKKVITREESLRNVAQVTKTRESIAALAEGKGIKKEFVDQFLALKSQMSDTARKLRAAGFSDDAVEANSKADILNKLIDAGFEIDEIVKASKNVDFNSPKEVAKFYRQFIKPTFMERLDEWRYGNMLSSPLTHLVNITSNAIQASVLNPATKLASGLIDNVASKLFGKEQEHFLREVPQVYRGMFNSFGEALSNSWSVFRGNKALHRLDVNRIPSGSKLTVVQRQFLQALEAGDAFFRTLIKGGEMESLASKYTKMGKKFTQETLEKEADKVAEYFTFRQGLDYTNKSKQGYLLSGIDGLTSLVMGGRNLPYVGKPIGWFVPFVQTPMNILKQGVEYSPIGVLTLPGNAKKVEQLGKAMIGSTVFAGAGYLALNNRTTWGVPTNEKEKELFYASGMQPYSVKIGDKWFSYSKLGPLAYPIAMASAIKYYWQDNPKSVDQNTAEKIGQIMGGVMKFFSDQSYVQGIAELGGFVQGDFGTGAIKSAENLIGQAVPLSSLQRWVNNIIDPVFRKTESKFDLKTVLKNLQAQLITQSDIQEPYLRPDGTESKRPFPFLNALNPFKASKENNSFKEKYDLNNELQKLSVQKKANDEDEKERITPILDHVTELEEQGKNDEAQRIKDSLSEDDWNTFKKIRQTRRDTEVANSKPEMLEVYKQVTYLESIGQADEAQRIKDSLTEEEWSAFKSVRNLAEGAK